MGYVRRYFGRKSTSGFNDSSSKRNQENWPKFKKITQIKIKIFRVICPNPNFVIVMRSPVMNMKSVWRVHKHVQVDLKQIIILNLIIILRLLLMPTLSEYFEQFSAHSYADPELEQTPFSLKNFLGILRVKSKSLE